MAASFNITLPGVGDQIIATVTETLKHYELDAKVPSASSIGEEVGKNVAAVLEATLSEFKKPVASSLREQILGEISFTVMPKDQNFTDLASQRRCDPQPLYW